jgi:ATP-dependent DNA helicase RecG
METLELLEIIARNEDSQHQFKANVTNAQQLAEEMVAFSNSNGGMILIGVNDKDGSIAGLTHADIGRLNNLISNAASQHIHPPVNPQTENIKLEEGLVLVVTVLEGINKPYTDNNGVIYVKNGADKRKVTAREEVQRMFQSAGLIHGDELPAKGLTVVDLDKDYFAEFFEKEYGETLEEQPIPLAQLLENMNLAKNNELNIAAALLFVKKPYFKLPAFIVKAVCYPSDDIHQSDYLDSQDIQGKLADVFYKIIGFIKRQLHCIQAGQNINSRGKLEIPEIVLEELLANALTHRDYFISAPIKIFVFSNRIEIISPGHLPNTLSIENIKNGTSNMRNSLL